MCAMMLLIGGCPKRQDRPSVVVYVPAHPPAATAVVSTEPSKPQVLVIEEPAPPPEPEPEPDETRPPQTPEHAASHHRRTPAHAATPAEPDETTTQETPETPPAEVPTLEPRESSAQETELRQQYNGLAQDIRPRLERMNGKQLSAADRRTLEDARTFFVQSGHALSAGDLPRALNLAKKAGLLLDALE